MRDERVRPRVSSVTAWRVRSTSVKPNASSRSRDRGLAERRRLPDSAASRGRNHTRSWARAHASPVLGEVAVERLGRPRLRRAAEAEHAGDAAAAVSVGRDDVGLALVLQLQDVLHPAQEPVGVGQRHPRRRDRRSRRGGDRRGRRGCRARAARRPPDRARAGGAARRTRRRGCHPARASRRARASPRRRASASARTFRPRTWRSSSAPKGASHTHRVGGRRPRGAELRVAGDRRRLEQRLPLPGLRPTAPSTPRRRRGCARAGRRAPRAAGGVDPERPARQVEEAPRRALEPVGVALARRA